MFPVSIGRAPGNENIPPGFLLTPGFAVAARSGLIARLRTRFRTLILPR